MAESKERIRELPLEDVMGERFGRYSKYIIQERALPDIRDGLKPVQRRILYAMYLDHNTYDKPYKKAAKSVGNVMGNFHPHGDSSIYGALVHLSQDWKMREPLVEMHGNNGSMDGDSPAAMRYTEARLSKISNKLLADIDKNTVPMVLNFDDTEYEPTVLPAQFPNLLVNGSEGISSGYATEIPPHNLGEVMAACVDLVKNPDASLAELMQDVQGPDFPTGGIIMGRDGIVEAYKTGRGRIQVRAKTSIQDMRGHRERIVVTEIPYNVNKALLVKRIDEIRLNKEIDGISEVRDETDRHGLAIVIELKKNAAAQNTLNYLFKNTDLQVSYNFNIVAIDDMTPVQVGLKRILTSFLKHKREVVTKRCEYDLKQAQDRREVLDGLIRALSILDDVIKTIRASKNKADAQKNLVAKFDFTKRQAEAIVALQLYRLTNTDVTALQKEHDQLEKQIAKLEKILGSKQAMDKQIIKELEEIKKEFASPRRTEISDETAKIEINTKKLIADEDVRVLVSANGYLKRSSLRSFASSSEGDNGLPAGDKVVFEKTVSTLTNLYLFTSYGNLIYRPVYELTEARWKDTGQHLSQELGLAPDEEIIRVFDLPKLSEAAVFLMATSDGFIKQTKLADLQPTRTYRSRAMVAMKLKEASSRLIYVKKLAADQKQEVVLLSKQGYGLRYGTDEIPVTGGRAAGVKSMNLKDGDSIAAVFAFAPETADQLRIGLLTQRGAYKQFKLELLAPISRAKRGLQVLRELKTKPHRIAAAVMFAENHELEIVTTSQRKLKIKTSDFPLDDRYSNGSFVLDPLTEGRPVSMTLGRPLPDGRTNVDSLF
jgi:topoisomerase-4 subunit A